MGLVRKEASRFLTYPGNTLDYEDLLSEGTIGLMKAIARFDVRKGSQLSTYAVWWVKQSIVRAIHQHGMAVRIPAHMADLVAKVIRTESNMETPDPEKVATKLHIPLPQYYHAKDVYLMFYQGASLNTAIGEEGDTELGELVDATDKHSTLGDLRGDPEIEFTIKERTELLEPVISRLKPKEQHVLRERFGESSPTLETLAKGMGITRERVRQIEKKALKRSRAFLKGQRYADWHVELEG